MNFEDNNFAELLKKLRDDTTTLVKEEVALAKTEVSESLARLSKHALTMAAGALIALAALVLLLFSLAGLLTLLLKSMGTPHDLAAFFGMFGVALISGFVAAAMGLAGLKAFKLERLVPHKSIQSLKEDKQLIKNNLP